MVRQLLGNIQGPRGPRGDEGPRGPKGDTAEITGLTVGTENLLNFSDLYYTYDGAIVNQDYESSRITFTNTGYQLRYAIELGVGKHIVKLDEVKNTDGAYDDYVRIELYNKNNNRIESYGNLYPNEYIEIEITQELYNVDNGQFNIYIVISGQAKANGYIDGLRVVKGDVAGSWKLSEKDKKHLESGYVYGTFTGDVTGTLTNRQNATLLIDPKTTEEVDNDEITLSEGYWLVTLSTRFSPIRLDSQILMYVMLNNQRQILLDLHSEAFKTGALSVVVKAEHGDKLMFEVGAGDTGVSFASLDTNRFTIKKVGV